MLEQLGNLKIAISARNGFIPKIQDPRDNDRPYIRIKITNTPMRKYSFKFLNADKR